MSSTKQSKETSKKRKVSRKGKNIIRKSIAGVLIATGLLIAAIPEDSSGIASAETSSVTNLNETKSPLNYDNDSLEARNGDFAFPYSSADALSKEGQDIYTSFTIDTSTGRARLIPDFEYYIPEDGIDGKTVGVTSRYCNQDTSSLVFDGVIVTSYQMVSESEYNDWWDQNDVEIGYKNSSGLLPTDNEMSKVETYFGTDDSYITWKSNYVAALEAYRSSHENSTAKTFTDIGMENNIFSKRAREMSDDLKYVYYCNNNNLSGFTLSLVYNLVQGKDYLDTSSTTESTGTPSQMPMDSEIYVVKANSSTLSETLKQKCDSNGYLIKSYQNIEAIGEGTFAKSSTSSGTQYYSNLKTVSFEGNIKYIGDRAFEGSTIESISIPSVKYIGNYVFKDCSLLSSITFNTDLQYIGKEAFYGCKRLKTLTMPATKLEIGFGAFAGCTELTTVDFDTNMNTGATIGEYAFYDCLNLNKVTFYSYSEYSFGKACFALPRGSGTGSSISASTPMTSFTFPQIKEYTSYTAPEETLYKIWDETGTERSSEIGDYIFANRYDLDSVKMPPDYGNTNPQWIPMNTFDNCISLGLLEFDSKQNTYVYYDSNLFEDVENTNLYVYGPQTKFYTDDINNSNVANPRYSTWMASTNVLDYVPYVYVDSSGVEHYEVGKGDYRYELEINADNTTASIISCELINQPSNPSTYVFEDDFVIPGQVAAYNITELTEGCLSGVKDYIKRLVVADGSLEVIDEGVFQNSKNLEEVVLGDSVKTIGSQAFADCAKLKQVTIGENIETIADGAFQNDPLLEDVYWDEPGSTASLSGIGQNAFKTGGSKLYFHCVADEDYYPFAYAMADNTINDKSVRICVKTLDPAVYTIIMDDMTGLATLIDYPLYTDLDQEIRSIYETGYATTSSSDGSVSENSVSVATTLNNEQLAKLNATLYLEVPEAVKSIDVKSFLDNSSNNANQKDWVYLTDASDANFVTANGNHTKDEIYGDDALKINSSLVSSLYTDGYTAGLFSGYLDDKTALIAYGDNNYPEYQQDIKGNDWILSVSLPGVLEIPDYAFDSCERLQSVIISEDCESIGESAFQGCDQLTTIGTNNNPRYQFENKILYENKDDGTLEINTCLPSRGSGKSGTSEIWVETDNDPLLAEVSSIKDGAFSGCSSIKTVDLSDTSVTRIPESCFQGCTSLSDVTLPDSVTSIATKAFDDGAPTLNVTVPSNSMISETAFDPDSTVIIWTYPENTVTASYQASNNDDVYIKYLNNRYYLTFLNDDMTVYEKIPVESGYNGYYPEEDPVPLLESNAGAVFSYWNFDNPNGIKKVTEDRTAQAIFVKPVASASDNAASASPGTGASSGTTSASASSSASAAAGASAAASNSASSTSSNAAVSATPSANAVTYAVVVENGAGSGNYSPGSVVTITAYAPDTGKEFDQWTTSNADIGFSNNTAVSTTFIMPTHDVKVTATYKTAGTSGSSSSSGSSGSSASGNSSGSSGSSGNKSSSSGTSVTVTTETIDNNNKNLVSATVAGSTDNFVVKITDSASAYAQVEDALKQAYGNDISNIKFVGFDISLYDETGQNKVENYDGLAVTITIPIPDDLVSYAGNNQAAAVINGVLDDKTTKFTTIDGVPCMTFTATHFSPYAVYVNTSTLTAGVSDATPKTGDISSKWFLSIGLCCIGAVLFLWKDKKKVAVAK